MQISMIKCGPRNHSQKKIIKDIDDSTVIGPDLIENDIFGQFNSTELSAGENA